MYTTHLTKFSFDYKKTLQLYKNYYREYFLLLERIDNQVDIILGSSGDKEAVKLASTLWYDNLMSEKRALIFSMKSKLKEKRIDEAKKAIFNIFKKSDNLLMKFEGIKNSVTLSIIFLSIFSMCYIVVQHKLI